MFGKRKTETEFIGVSVSRDKRNAIMLFVVEGILVLLFITGILFVLNFVGIISLSSINSAIFGSLPVKEQESKPVEVVSEIPGYILKLKNEKEIIELLESWGVYDKEYKPTYGATGSTNGTPLKTIAIHLVSEPQGTNAFGTGLTKESIYSSSLTNISPGRFDVNIYISDSIIDGQDKNFSPSIAMRATFLSSLYKIINPYKDAKESAQISSAFNEEFKTNPLMQLDYFEISKE